MAKIKYVNREISWLKFNARVLQEARDSSVPLLERLRFLGIYSNNLDEFYKVRYATVLRALEIDASAYDNIVENQTLSALLEEIQNVVAHQRDIYDETFQSIVSELEKEDIYFVDETELSESQSAYVAKYFQNKLSHNLAVYLWSPADTIPQLRDGAFYLVVKMYSHAPDQNNIYALIEVPAHLFSRFVILPKEGSKNYIILLEDVIRQQLKNVFPFFEFDEAEAHSIKITKDAKLDIDNDVQRSFIDRIAKSVEGRKRGEPVRLVYDKNISQDTLDFLKKILHIDELDNLSPGGKYHNKKDFLKFPDIGRPDLEFKKITPLVPTSLKGVKRYIDAIENQDHLLYAPYTDYSLFLKLLREAAIDPRVKSIKMTVYRVAERSQVMSALLNAAKNGKEVTAVLELRARFDEVNNVNWSRKLQDQGVNVIFGVPGLKVHSKIGVIAYESGNQMKQISFVSTGNFHEKTARIYTDFTLLTANKQINQEINYVFDFFESNYKVRKYKHLMVSPSEMRKKVKKLILNEIQNAKKGKPAQINIKVNSLSDKKIIDLLYKASKNGVEVRLVVRGICCLIPQVPGLSENIKAISVVDKYLEHPRVYWFKNAGDDLIYISSADLMTRNIDFRVEVGCPIYSEAHKKQIMDTFELNFTDNVKGRVHNATLLEPYQENDLPNNRSHVSIYKYYQELYK